MIVYIAFPCVMLNWFTYDSLIFIWGFFLSIWIDRLPTSFEYVSKWFGSGIWSHVLVSVRISPAGVGMTGRACVLRLLGTTDTTTAGQTTCQHGAYKLFRVRLKPPETGSVTWTERCSKQPACWNTTSETDIKTSTDIWDIQQGWLTTC